MFIRNLSVLLGTLLLIFTVPDVSAYSKYGRTCQDIGCRSDEVCVIAEDACSTYQRENCGRYPTCKKKSGEASCSSLICGPNEYCRTENGHPQCVRKTSSNEYESAGVSVVNGQRIDGGSVNTNTNTHKNPFANANAPPEPPDVPFGSGGDYHRVHTGSDLGYPPDPPRSGYNSNNNNGYPAYPGYPPSSNNQGYPPYPTQNRMPVPGYPQQYPPQYPQQYPGSHHYPQSNPGGFQYPSGHSVYPQQNTPYQTQKGYGSGNSIYRYNSGSMISSSMIVIILSSCLIIFLTHKS